MTIAAKRVRSSKSKCRNSPVEPSRVIPSTPLDSRKSVNSSAAAMSMETPVARRGVMAATEIMCDRAPNAQSHLRLSSGRAGVLRINFGHRKDDLRTAVEHDRVGRLHCLIVALYGVPGVRVLLETWTAILWPVLKTSDVDHRSTVIG